MSCSTRNSICGRIIVDLLRTHGALPRQLGETQYYAAADRVAAALGADGIEPTAADCHHIVLFHAGMLQDPNKTGPARRENTLAAIQRIVEENR